MLFMRPCVAAGEEWRGIGGVTGTPSASVRMGIVYLRAGVVLNNVQLQITLHEGV
jgi:hypothetical protein